MCEVYIWEDDEAREVILANGTGWINLCTCQNKKNGTTAQSTESMLQFTHTSHSKHIDKDNQMWVNMPYMDATGGDRLLCSVTTPTSTSCSWVTTRSTVTLGSTIHSWGRGLDHAQACREKKSGGRRRFGSWWRGFWNLWCHEVWLGFFFLRMIFMLYI